MFKPIKHRYCVLFNIEAPQLSVVLGTLEKVNEQTNLGR